MFKRLMKEYVMRLFLLACAVLLAAPAYAQTVVQVPPDCVYDYANHSKCGPGVHPADPPQLQNNVPPGTYIDAFGRRYPPAPHDRSWGEAPPSGGVATSASPHIKLPRRKFDL